MKSHRDFEIGVGFTLLSSVCIATLGLFGKLGIAIDSLSLLVFLRFFFPIVIVVPFLWAAGFLKHISMSHFSSQLVRCLCVSASAYCFFYYLKSASILNVSLLYNTGPVFIPLFSRIFYKHKIDLVEVLSILISIVGLCFILNPDQGIFDHRGIFGILSGIFMAGSQTIFGENAKREHVGSNLFYLFFFPTLFAIPALLLFPPSGSQVGAVFGHVPMLLIFLGIALSSIFNQVLRGFAYTHAKAASLAPFLYFSAIVAALLDWGLFDVYPTIPALIGFLLILGASILKYLFHKRASH